AGDLLERLAGIGAGLLVRTLDDIDAGTADPTPQEGEVTLAPTLRSADGRIEWALPAEQVSAKIRGVTPAPGAWTRTRDGDRFKIGPVTILDGAPLPAGTLHAGGDRVAVGTGTRSVALERLAPPGKPWTSASEWARGLRTETLEFEVAPWVRARGRAGADPRAATAAPTTSAARGPAGPARPPRRGRRHSPCGWRSRRRPPTPPCSCRRSCGNGVSSAGMRGSRPNSP